MTITTNCRHGISFDTWLTNLITAKRLHSADGNEALL